MRDVVSSIRRWIAASWQPRKTHVPGSPAPYWLIASAILIGAVLGACGQMRMPIEERLLDGGLVLAGQVSYPDGAVMGLYYRGVWTLLYQLGAIALKLGMNYSTANLVFLLIPPALLTGALALFLHGLTGRPLFALVAAILCFMNSYFVALFASSDYPLLGMAWNTPSPHSYGRFGGVLAALSFAALVGGRNALAGFAAGGLISVHPVIGVYTTTMLALGLGAARLAWKYRIPRSTFLGFGAGLSVSLISLAVFLSMRPAMPDVDAETNRAYTAMYYSFWDDHRNKVATPADLLRVAGLVVVLVVPLLGFMALRRGRREAADVGALVLLIAVFVSTSLYVMTHWAKDLLPDVVIRGIPGRLINMQACFAMAILVGMTVFVADEIARRQRPGGYFSALRALMVRYPSAIAVSVVVIMLLRFLPGFAYGLVVAWKDPELSAMRQELAEIDSPFWTKVRALAINRPVLAEPGLSLKALRYGRLPIALDTTAIDFVPYLPRTATALGTLVERGYGVSFFRPPPAMKFRGILPVGTGRDFWACLSPDQWQRIVREFGTVALLVPADWTVNLPPLLKDGSYALYMLPAGQSGQANESPDSAEAMCPLLHD